MLESLLILLAVQSPATQPAPAVVTAAPAAARPLRALPNIQIEQYDVSGSTIEEINNAIMTAGGTPGQAASSSSADWSLKADLSQSTTAGKCTITAAKATMSAKVRLPRHVNPQALAAPVRAAWEAYLASLESRQASDLWFVHDNLSQVERPLVGLACGEANAAWNTALSQLQARQAAFRLQNEQAAAQRAAAEQAAAAAAAKTKKK